MASSWSDSAETGEAAAAGNLHRKKNRGRRNRQRVEAGAAGSPTPDRLPGLHGPQRGVRALPGHQFVVGAPSRRPGRASSTWITSALRTVDSRWAITSVVRSAEIRSSERWMAASVSLSTADVASSSSRMTGVLEHGPRDRDALSLTAGQLLAPFADDRVVAVGERSSRSRGPRPPWRPRRRPRARHPGGRRRCSRAPCRGTGRRPG